VALKDCTVNGTEESFCVDLHLRLLPAVAVVHGRVPGTHAAVRGDGLVWLGQFLSQRLGYRPRDALVRFDLVQGITVALEELDRLSAQAENVMAIG
jgi:hypothetical protein